MEIQSELVNHNATPSAFGWDFQFNAAIIIMLENIKDAQEVRVEGKIEDIEVVLKDNVMIYAQAKSCTNPEDTTNALRDLKNALTTLSGVPDAKKAKSLIFVTNRIDPFKEPSTIRKFAGGYSFVPYKELTEKCTNRIEKICKKYSLSLSKNNFFVLTFDFSGDGENRYRIVKLKIAEFLETLEGTYIGLTKKTLERWQYLYGRNASQNDRSKKISKEEMIWPIIVWLCEKDPYNFLQKFDKATSSEIASTYNKIIENASERFDFITKVMYEYAKYEKSNSGKRQDEVTENFISEKSILFHEDFDLSGLDDDIAIAVIKFAVDKVIRERFNINKIKEKVNL